MLRFALTFLGGCLVYYDLGYAWCMGYIGFAVFLNYVILENAKHNYKMLATHGCVCGTPSMSMGVGKREMGYRAWLHCPTCGMIHVVNPFNQTSKLIRGRRKSGPPGGVA